MEIEYTGIFFGFIKLIIAIMIIMAVAIIVRRCNHSKDRNTEKDTKTDNVLKGSGKNKIIAVLTIVIDVIFALILPFSLVGAMIAPMTFDAPGSEKSLYNWLFFGATFSFPMVILMTVITSLIFLFKLKLNKKAIMISLLPIFNIIIVVVIILLNRK